jgi:hypothetical protein
MAIDAIDRRRVSWLAEELSIAMHVFFEMAVRALHSMRQMHILQLNCLREFVRIVLGDFVVAQIEQITFAIVFEDCPENPAVTVVIGKLGVLEFRI